jgi:hypothetical protein
METATNAPPPDTDGTPTTADWVHLVQAEYLEMPGLQLTRAQVCRLWGFEEHTCDAVLDELMTMRFLKCTPRHLYVLNAPVC